MLYRQNPIASLTSVIIPMEEPSIRAYRPLTPVSLLTATRVKKLLPSQSVFIGVQTGLALVVVVGRLVSAADVSVVVG